MSKAKRELLLALFVAAPAGLAIAVISGKPFWQILIPSILLGFIGFFLIFTLARFLNSAKVLIAILLISFGLRLGLGLLSGRFLPLIGYNEAPQQAGYLFRDAFNRDTQAWQLAQSEQPIFAAFGNEFFSDQYGGLLAISALIYRSITSHQHFPQLIILLGAMVSVLGILFVGDLFIGTKRAGSVAVLVYAFFPDAILFSASQMREPFLMGFSALLFWLACTNRSTGWRKWIIFGVVSLLTLLISIKSGLFVILFAGVIAFWQSQKKVNTRLPVYYFSIGLIVFGVILAVISGRWILEASKWDAIVAVQNSGWVELIFKQLPEQFHLPFLTVYGLIQPVLPAALVEPSIAFWKTINIVRASGWVVITPFIAYSIISLFYPTRANRKFWTLITFFVIFWLSLSALRAGGDLWDNPRYRLTMIVPIALLVGELTDRFLTSRDHWFKRTILAVGIFNIIFLQWYLSRYTLIFGRLDFPVMIAIISAAIFAIFIHGVIHSLGLKKRTSS